MQGPTYIYSGEGTWKLSVDQTFDMLKDMGFDDIHTVDDLSKVDQATRMVVVPGGNAAYMYSTLVETAEKVSEYVQNGGTYLGICAGAISVTDRVVSNGESLNQSEIIKTLYSGTCGIHRYLKNHDNPSAPENLRAVKIQGGGTVPFYSGPIFLDPPKEANVLFTYAEPAEAAAISCPLARGKVVLVGFHPEFNPNTFDAKAKECDFPQDLPPDLRDYQQIRPQILDCLLKELTN